MNKPFFKSNLSEINQHIYPSGYPGALRTAVGKEKPSIAAQRTLT